MAEKTIREYIVRQTGELKAGAYENAPTTAIIVEEIQDLVRCRDCVHCDCLPDYMGFFYCDFDEGRTVSGNGFCDVAERRTDAHMD